MTNHHLNRIPYDSIPRGPAKTTAFMYFSHDDVSLLSATLKRTASSQNVALRVFHRPNVAVMRWRALFGLLFSLLLQTQPFS
jgi:hypothetical protein